MEKSSSKLMVLVLALLFFTSYMQVETEASYTPCNTKQDSVELLPDCKRPSCKGNFCRCKLELPPAPASAKVHGEAPKETAGN
ncbi:hypothetical protein L6164_003192 [Bauhinia variegata]|uniref:Uncharacterized protein n=1 Tax=Bauhinia variegata TaxID=167791 RepID=A0ACB9Q0K8_BAUVA|nr:hypothetical protein L6164_003192 [Bauhinia variegata]